MLKWGWKESKSTDVYGADGKKELYHSLFCTLAAGICLFQPSGEVITGTDTTNCSCGCGVNQMFQRMEVKHDEKQHSWRRVLTEDTGCGLPARAACILNSGSSSNTFIFHWSCSCFLHKMFCLSVVHKNSIQGHQSTSSSAVSVLCRQIERQILSSGNLDDYTRQHDSLFLILLLN